MTGGTRILVTGGAGYIGSVIVELLLERGRSVVVLDDLSRGHRQAVSRGASFIQGSVGNHELVQALLDHERIEAIIHMAAFALVPESVAEPQKYVTNNVTAARVLLEAAGRAKVRRFVFSSSCAVYGHPATIPISEDAPQAPVNPYGETKRDFERLLADFGPRNGLAVVSLRYFNAAGATEQRGEDHEPETHLIPNVLAAAMGKRSAVDVFGTDYPTPDGTAVRDYVHVVDIADAHVRALDVRLDHRAPIAVNLGTGTGRSVREIVERARRVTGRAVPTADRPRRAGDPPALVAAAGRAADVLGWRATRSSLEEILESAWRWHQAHPHGYRGES
ncbi:MAG TPA: UDP-glucose 4-epimerase GalE [Gemmatimonadales bacterium]|nr:UDP-glucose 4-epimerase GalE [Gemmatimonadales bacterium]